MGGNSFYDEAEDEVLTLAALVGDLQAFDTLCKRYRNAVTLTAQQIVGSRAVAEDIAQDTFVAAFQSLPHLEDPARIGPWLRAIARFRAIRVVQRDRRQEPKEASDMELLLERREAGSAGSHVPDDPADVMALRVERDRIWDALERVSPEHREVIYLYYGEDWSLAHIADFLQVPETTVKGRLHRGREALRRRLAALNDYEPRRPKGDLL